ncbi:ABC transporter permease [Oceanibacterium hippocampi]|uniref:Dipeptide transport system permease protein DppB n=1 Tax=Oceanibacterium hippocampi TaxID=745714 RepID=A0A1Y5R980_9PROT|nr:ABC transporter permease [Oceanibacterium hippocampi]SLN12086.1 Dipeptide transport system permease protein DppB [Oceanibacterium hippocampi]
MSVFLFKRLLTFILTLFGASVIIFAAMEILPGDPALVILGVDASPEAVQALTEKLGLDRPVPERYFDWITGVLGGDFGISYSYKTPVSELIIDSLKITVPLAIMAMLLATAIAIVLGIYAAANHNRPADVGIMGISQLGISIPSFWLGILLVLLFAVNLRWFSAGGFPGWDRDFFGSFRALILPAVSLATVQAAILARITRSAVLDVFREDFVRTARAKGVSRRRALWGHVLRNALIPVITIMGLQFANLLAGTVVIESVFTLPGLGQLVLKAINNRDLIIVEGTVLLLAAMVVAVNFLVDILYALIDPRLKVSDI